MKIFLSSHFWTFNHETTLKSTKLIKFFKNSAKWQHIFSRLLWWLCSHTWREQWNLRSNRICNRVSKWIMFLDSLNFRMFELEIYSFHLPCLFEITCDLLLDFIFYLLMNTTLASFLKDIINDIDITSIYKIFRIMLRRSVFYYMLTSSVWTILRQKLKWMGENGFLCKCR